MNNVLSCQDVAKYFLILVNREEGDLITQLKLQKLMYFAQGVSLAIYKKPLFSEAIEAWEHGPVVKELRKKPFGGRKAAPIPTPKEMDFDIYTQPVKELIYKIYSKYGEHTASFLRNSTHKHSIWIEAFSNPTTKIIAQEKLKVFFDSLIKEEGIDFLLTSDEHIQGIIKAEDEWWMGYDSGVPSEEITEI